MKKSRYISTLLLLLGLTCTQAAATSLQYLTGFLITSASFLSGGNAQTNFGYQSAYGSQDDVFNGLAVYIDGTSSTNDRVCGAGYTQSYGYGNKDGLLICYGNDGDRKFTHEYGYLLDDLFKDVIVDPNDNLVMGGSTKNFLAVKQDMYLVQTDRDGDLIWAGRAGSTQNDVIEGLAATSNGWVSTGWTNKGYSAQKKDMLVIKYSDTTSTSPVIDWARRIGSTNHENGKGIAVHPTTGDIIAVGNTQSFSAAEGIMAVQFDSSGNEDWAVYIGGMDNGLSDYLYITEGASVAVDSSGNSYIAGFGWKHSLSSPIESDVLVVKLTSSGSLGWKKLFGQFTVIDEELFAIDYHDGSVAVSGFSRGYGATQKGAITAVLDATTGNIEWLSSVDGSSQEEATGVKFNRDGNVIASGWTTISSKKATFATEFEVSDGTSDCGTIASTVLVNDTWVVVEDIKDDLTFASITVTLTDITNDVEVTKTTNFGESTTCPQ